MDHHRKALQDPGDGTRIQLTDQGKAGDRKYNQPVACHPSREQPMSVKHAVLSSTLRHTELKSRSGMLGFVPRPLLLLTS